MAQITLSPHVENYFVTMDWHDSQKNASEFSKELVNNYETGKVILIRNAPFSIDYELVNRITLPRGRTHKKLSDSFFLYPRIYDPKVVGVLMECFEKDPGLYLKFRRQVNKLHAEIDRFFQIAFEPYKFIKGNISWRLTESSDEFMHVDYFHNDEDVQYIRMFINVDQQPRIWNVTHSIDELAARYYRGENVAELEGTNANEFCEKIGLLAFGGAENAGKDGHHRHIVEFDQGDVWLCDSRVVPHQVIFGRRAVSAKFRADPNSMLDPSQRVVSRVKRYHEIYGHC